MTSLQINWISFIQISHPKSSFISRKNISKPINADLATMQKLIVLQYLLDLLVLRIRVGLKLRANTIKNHHYE